jgi:hypothetical protein
MQIQRHLRAHFKEEIVQRPGFGGGEEKVIAVEINAVRGAPLAEFRPIRIHLRDDKQLDMHQEAVEQTRSASGQKNGQGLFPRRFIPVLLGKEENPDPIGRSAMSGERYPYEVDRTSLAGCRNLFDLY